MSASAQIIREEHAMKRYQFVNWFPSWHGFHFYRPLFGMHLLYDWYLYLGWCEIRKWHKLKAGEMEAYRQQCDADYERRTGGS